MTAANSNPETQRLDDDRARAKNWKRWGPYLPERQWGTVREDYSEDGEAWQSFPFDHAHLRAYRWGEDGLLGFTDRQCRICFSLGMWNGQDDRLKERPFGLNGSEGNHGEDLKELYYYLDSTPTHSYSKALYKYPQAAFPYQALREENSRRGLEDPEYELLDTGIFDNERFFDVQVEYAKDAPDDILIQISVTNRGPEKAAFHQIPKLFFRNTWIWGCKHEGCTLKPAITLEEDGRLKLHHETLADFYFETDQSGGIPTPAFLFCENETNNESLYQSDTYTPYTKDGINRFVVQGQQDAVNPESKGTIVGVHQPCEIESGQTQTFRYRLYSQESAPKSAFGKAFDKVFSKRIQEADAFYDKIIPGKLTPDEQSIQRQAYAGLLWTKQFYHYSVSDWLEGDPNIAPAPESRKKGRNRGWTHLFNRDVISMPDKWEYPWYAAWDSAFHCIPIAEIDPDYAKEQLILFLREWYMHPNGQIPAYEWAFGDVNPPVHAWACWQVYQKTRDDGTQDLPFLERVFQKLLLNFTWWVNRKDPDGANIFSGGFLGLDNIGLFDRSKPLPGGLTLHQADGTAWMAFYCSSMLAIALELARHNKAYSDIASKFFEHFMSIADAINNMGENGLWDDEDGFYYDEIRNPNDSSHSIRLKIRSMVGLIPLYAVEVLDTETIESLPFFKKRMDWYLDHRKDIAKLISVSEPSAENQSILLAIPSRERLERMLAYLFSEEEFLAPHGIRSLSQFHRDSPFSLNLDGNCYEVAYTPGDSDTHLFGGNSNWRGPIWFPVNYLIIQSLDTYHKHYGDSFKVEVPTGSGNWLTLAEAAAALRQRLSSLFTQSSAQHRPCHGAAPFYAADRPEAELPLYYEFFHGDNGLGLGASHQTGWTALVATLLKTKGET